MKRTFLYILAALLAMSCKNNSVQNKNEDDKPVITVTIEPLRYFTEAIAGDNFNVVSKIFYFCNEIERLKFVFCGVDNIFLKTACV